jgi:calmodulin
MQQHTKPVDKALMDAFRAFDKNGDGMLSAVELKAAMAGLGNPLSDPEIEAMIRLADSDGNGKVDYEEFAKMLGK